MMPEPLWTNELCHISFREAGRVSACGKLLLVEPDCDGEVLTGVCDGCGRRCCDDCRDAYETAQEEASA